MRTLLLLGALVPLALPMSSVAQDFDKVELKTTAVGGSVHAIFGRGGNIGVSAGEDGVFLIDDQFAPLSDKIKAEVAALGAGEVRFIVNTHWHFDHTGGNEIFGADGALIVAHDNVRERMSVDQFIAAFDREVPASPKVALPVVTFDDGVTFHLNGDTIRVIHVPHAHTDGDAIVHFSTANVIHAGDTVWTSGYPFIDTGSGGSIDGVIAAADPDAFKGLTAFTLQESGVQQDFVYFSFVTLTTLGYGDMSPVAPIAKTLAWFEAVFGQLFLAVTIARLVSLEIAHKEKLPVDN
jgi:glyoxylase-like metal-dependent hydrolase (beta-lactamase superfamily II)